MMYKIAYSDVDDCSLRGSFSQMKILNGFFPPRSLFFFSCVNNAKNSYLYLVWKFMIIYTFPLLHMKLACMNYAC